MDFMALIYRPITSIYPWNISRESLGDEIPRLARENQARRVILMETALRYGKVYCNLICLRPKRSLRIVSAKINMQDMRRGLYWMMYNKLISFFSHSVITLIYVIIAFVIYRMQIS